MLRIEWLGINTGNYSHVFSTQLPNASRLAHVFPVAGLITGIPKASGALGAVAGLTTGIPKASGALGAAAGVLAF